MPSRRRSRILRRIAMGVEILSVSDRLLAAAINGVYQGIVITALVALGLRALNRTNAATRHAVWLCTMVLLVFLVVAHCVVGSRPRALRPQQVAGIATAKQESDLATFDAVPVTAIDDEKPLERDQPLGLNRSFLSLSLMTTPFEEAQPPVGNPAILRAETVEERPANQLVAVQQPAASEGKDRWFDP